jgi:hypothetical protein
MPFDSVLVLTGIIIVFAVFALVVGYVNHVAGGPGFAALDGAVSGHVSAHAVTRADIAPDLIRRKEGHDDLAESHSTIH